jgi:hypothetical protein
MVERHFSKGIDDHFTPEETCQAISDQFADWWLRAWNRIRRCSFHGRNLRFAMLRKEIVEGLGKQILDRRVVIGSENSQLLLDRWRKVASDI